MKIKKQNDTAITLIALVVTIVILLILACVTILTITGDNGLFTITKKAKKDTIDAQISENEILDNYLYAIDESNEEDKDNVPLKEIKIENELVSLLKEANMKITLNDLLNAPGIMENINGLIPTLTANNVIREENDDVVKYSDSFGGEVITNSEHDEGATWYIFDKNIDTQGYSKEDEAKGYYIEYKFAKDTYVLSAKYIFSNASKHEGTRVFVIQGYDEENGQWENLTEDLTWIGNQYTKNEKTVNLQYTKSYKRFRFFVKEATYTSTIYGGKFSGFYELQLYGVASDEIQDFSEENLKKILLSNYTLDTITLNQIITNVDFKERLINSLSIQTVKNNETLKSNLLELIPNISEGDIERKEIDDVVIYVDSFGGELRTNSEHDEGPAWYIYDKNIDTQCYSRVGEAKGYYIEYKFTEDKYALSAKYIFTNGSKHEGTRVFVIQGYDEENGQWENLTEDLTWIGNQYTKNEETVNLQCTKSYKRFRVLVKDATYTSSVYGESLSGFYELQLYGKNASN